MSSSVQSITSGNTPCRPAAAWAGRRRGLLRGWFAAGACVSLAVGLAAVGVLLRELLAASFLGSPAAEGAAGAATAGGLQLAVPGVTLPASHALVLWLGVVLAMSIHEVRLLGHQLSNGGAVLGQKKMLPAAPGITHIHPPSGPPLHQQAGHALAAAAEGVALESAGVTWVLGLPAAHVHLNSAQLSLLPRWPALRIAAAGVWHNAVLAAACLAVAFGLRAAPEVLARFVRPLALLVGYTGSVSAALALLNAAPVHWLDGEHIAAALLLCGRRPAPALPVSEGDAAAAQGEDEAAAKGHGGGSGRPRAAAAVRWVLHSGTALFAAVLLLHVTRLRSQQPAPV